MSGMDPEKLLGGYATGTLTEGERRRLFEAALHDQLLFNALADEQVLKDLLDDPISRRYLIETLEQADRANQQAEGWGALVPAWLHLPAGVRPGAAARPASQATPPPAPSRQSVWGGPWRWALGSGLVLAVLALVVAAYLLDEMTQQPEPLVTADSRSRGDSEPQAPPPPGQALPPPAPSPAAPVSTPASPQPVAPGIQAAGNRPPWPSARDLFYRSVEKQMADKARLMEEQASEARKPAALTEPVPKPLGLRYSIVKHGPEGSDSEVNPALALSEEDAPHLAVEVTTSGYLYVLKRTSPGVWTLMFPPAGTQPDSAGRSAYVEGGTRYLVPASGTLMDAGQRGPAQVVIILSRGPQPELAEQSLIGLARPESNPARAARISDVIRRIRAEVAGGKLLVERVGASHPNIPGEEAVYVVDRSPVPASRILAELMVSHR